MRSIELEEMKKLELDMLLWVRDLCQKNNINYFLSYGTLLGAVRHQGFIPWDDDVDVSLSREDYDKLLSCAKKAEHPYYKVLATELSDKYDLPFAKVIDTRTTLVQKFMGSDQEQLGVYIDLFPVYGLPDSVLATKVLFYRERALAAFRKASTIDSLSKIKLDSNIIKRLCRYMIVLPSKTIGYRKIVRKMETIAKRYKYNDCRYVGCTVWGEGIKERIEKSCLNEYVEVTFEKEVFKAPAAYEKYLTNLYGDYLKLPPVEERVSQHSYEVYWNT